MPEFGKRYYVAKILATISLVKIFATNCSSKYIFSKTVLRILVYFTLIKLVSESHIKTIYYFYL